MLHSFLKHIFRNDLVFRLFSKGIKASMAPKREHKSQGRVTIQKAGAQGRGGVVACQKPRLPLWIARCLSILPLSVVRTGTGDRKTSSANVQTGSSLNFQGVDD